MIKVKYMSNNGKECNKTFNDNRAYDKWRFKRNFYKILTKTIDGQCTIINN